MAERFSGPGPPAVEGLGKVVTQAVDGSPAAGRSRERRHLRVDLS